MKLISYEDIKVLNVDPAICYEWVSEMIINKKQTQLPPKISMHLADDIFCNVMPCIIPGDAKEKMGG